MGIKEKVLKEVKKEYSWWEMNEPEEYLFNSILSEVEKIIDKLKEEDNTNPGAMGPYDNDLIYVENYVDVDELKLRLRDKI